MALPFGVFGELFSSAAVLDGNHFYDNAVYQALKMNDR